MGLKEKIKSGARIAALGLAGILGAAAMGSSGGCNYYSRADCERMGLNYEEEQAKDRMWSSLVFTGYGIMGNAIANSPNYTPQQRMGGAAISRLGYLAANQISQGGNQATGNANTIIINGQVYAPVNSFQQAQDVRQRLPGPIAELFYFEIATGAVDRNRDNMLGYDELIGINRSLSKNQEFKVYAKYAGAKPSESFLRVVMIKKGIFGWMKWEAYSNPGIKIPYGNCWYETLRVNPGQLNPGKYELLMVNYSLINRKIFDFEITE